MMTCDDVISRGPRTRRVCGAKMNWEKRDSYRPCTRIRGCTCQNARPTYAQSFVRRTTVVGICSTGECNYVWLVVDRRDQSPLPRWSVEDSHAETSRRRRDVLLCRLRLHFDILFPDGGDGGFQEGP